MQVLIDVHLQIVFRTFKLAANVYINEYTIFVKTIYYKCLCRRVGFRYKRSIRI